MKNLCDICPRNCKIDRCKNKGFCGTGDKVLISLVNLFHYEEPIISGDETISPNPIGSGAIFFAGCNLKCAYCQNSEISSKCKGKEYSIEKLANIFKELEEKGAYNINLVTPTHFTTQILKALEIYKPKIPIVWNTSGYESIETIKKLRGKVDIFLTDLKYLDSDISQKYSNAKNYPKIAKASILEMRKIVPNDVIENGLMKKGLIVRHLVLPNQTRDSLNVINWIYNNLGNKTYFSLMSQYVPVANAKNFPEINRKIKPAEYNVLVSKLNHLKFINVFLQDPSSADCIYIPKF